MAKIGLGNAGKYTSNGNGGYFTLVDDGDSAVVRFLYDQPDGSDIDYFLVHQVEIDGKRRWVSCNGVDEEGNLHKEDCPLCKSGNRPQEKLFLQLLNMDTNEVQVWERGKTYVQKILTYLNRYGNLSAVPMEIVRQGKKGDQQTTYEFFVLDKDGQDLSTLDVEKLEIEGTLVIKASNEDMEDMIEGIYTTGAPQQQAQPQQQRRNEYQRRGGDRGQRRRNRIENRL